MLETDRPIALRQAIHACRKGGTVSIPGVYGGFLDKVPFGAAFVKGADVQDGPDPRASLPAPLLEQIETRRDRPVLRHHAPLPLAEAPEAYEMFRDKQDGCIKVVIDPAASAPSRERPA